MRTKEHDPKHVHGLAGVFVKAALAFVVGCAVVAGMLLSAPSAGAADFHGIGFAKGCNRPTILNQPYVCMFEVTNTLDSAHDTLTFSSVVDVVHAYPNFAGDVTSTNLMLLGYDYTIAGTASCDVGHTSCTIPYGLGNSVTFTATFYNVHANDLLLPTPAPSGLPTLTDTATLTFQDTCDHSPLPSNCPYGQNSLHTQAGSQSDLITPTPTPTPTFTFTPTPTPTFTFTPTPTATPTPHLGVGGAVELPPAAITDGSSASDSGWPVAAYLGVAGAVLAISVGGWYARKRWLA